MTLHLLSSWSYTSEALISWSFSVPHSLYHIEGVSVDFWFCVKQVVQSEARQQNCYAERGKEQS